MYDEIQARELVIRAGLELIKLGLVARTWGNVSARISDTEFVITPSGMAYDTLKVEDLVKVKIEDCSYEGDIKPSSEKGVHAAVYSMRSNANFVIHTHQFYASALAADEQDMDFAPCAEYGLPGTGKLKKNLTMLLYTLMYILSSFYWIAFWFFQKSSFQPLIGEKNCQTLFIVFFCCYTLIAVVNYFSHFCFYISEEGVLITKSLLLVILTTLWFIIYILTAITGKANIKTKLTLSSYALLPLLGWISVLIFYDSTFFSNIFESLDILFYLISLYLLFFSIYVEQGQIAVQREKELIDSRAKAMTLKIRPHFIANTMSSIVALCDSDSAKAGELASKFAKYLRDNYADMTDEPMIPFSQELEHIKNYLSIEQIRFENLNVEYDIQVENFSLPALTIQPLVENAVRHGISKMPGAKGNLLIKTYTYKGNYVIEIRDDGVGYVPTAQNDNRSHIGITNARFRLETLCHGSLKISGDADKGTICEVRIPIDYNEEK